MRVLVSVRRGTSFGVPTGIPSPPMRVPFGAEWKTERRLLTCLGGGCQALLVFSGVADLEVRGGAWARWGIGVCPRTPRLTSVLDPGWLRVGYMMCDGGFRQMVVRPLSLSRPPPGMGRQQAAGSWPRVIG